MRFLTRRRRTNTRIPREGLDAPAQAAVSAPRQRSFSAIRQAAWTECLEDRRLFAANLVLTNTGLPTPNVNAGQVITYTVSVRNVGTDFASNVTLNTDIPTNTTFVSLSQAGGPNFVVTAPAPGGTGTITATLGQLNSAVGTTFTIAVRVDPSTADGTIVSDTASVSTTTAETTTTDNSATVNTIVNTRADVSVAKTGPATVVAGTDATYTITIANNGPSNAANVKLTDIVPTGFTFRSFAQDPAGPTFVINGDPLTPLPPVGGAGTVEATIASLASGVSKTFTIVLRANPSLAEGDTVFNTATITTTTFDPAQANNVSTADTDVLREADMYIVSDSDKVNPTVEGTRFTYTLVIGNKGPSNAEAATFTWNTPNNGPIPYIDLGIYYVSIQRVSGPAWNINVPPDPPRRGQITGSIADMPAGVASTYRITVETGENQNAVQNSSTGTATTDLDPTNNTHTDNLRIVDAPLTVVSTPDIQGNAGQALFVTLMDFQDTNAWGTLPGQYGSYQGPLGRMTELVAPGFLPNDFTATVDWGDGTTPTAAIISVDAAGTYKVSGSHVYANPGVYGVRVLVTSDGESTAVGNALALIGQPPRGGSGLPGLKFTENALETKQIAAFFNGGSGGAPSGVINWGDGTATSPATFVSDGVGGFRVNGTHNYVNEGTYNGSITVTDSNGTVNINFTVTVDDIPVLATPVNVVAQTGILASGVPVATFTDPGGNDPIGAYSASINWGDGTAPTTGTITFNAGNGVYTITGDKSYAAAGTYNVTVTIGNGPAADVVVIGTATVTDGPINPAVNATAVNVAGNVNVALTNVVVATFTDPGPDGPVGEYTAVINWGDGSPATNGVISYNSTTQVYTVRGTKTYTAAGSYNMTVSITHGTSPTTVVNPTAIITPASTVATLTPQNFTGVEGRTISGQIVARFTTPNLNATATQFAATINWGDGTPVTNATIVRTGPGTFNVVGTKQYRDDGTFNLTVIVTPAGGAGVVCTPNPVATITNAPLTGISRIFNATRNQSFTGIVGSFKDGNPFDLNPAEYTVSINWGDGTAATAGTLVYNTGLQRWDIRGTKTYTRVSPVGGFKLTITVRDGPTQTIRINSTATVR